MTEIEFAKYHGLGNDFVIIEDTSESTFLAPPEVAAMCAPHTGVGADGLLIVRPSESADFAMVYYNADGSEALDSHACQVLRRQVSFSHDVVTLQPRQAR